MKFLRILGYILLSLIVLLTAAFFILKHNPKPEIITLERKVLTDDHIDQKARELVDQMSIEEQLDCVQSLWDRIAAHP